ncbi:MAG: hypothetical protein ABI599_05345 [Flavobacteriales bacterium]
MRSIAAPLFVLLLSYSFTPCLLAQERVTTFGIQAKPVLPLGFFKPVTTFEDGALNGTVELTGGFAFGGLVRAGLTKSISLEVGINQIQRRYDWSISNDTSAIAGKGSVRWIGYEVPVLALVYVRLGERSWMNNAIGFSADMYPSDVVESFEDTRTYWYRKSWLQAGVVANVGFEYRTLKSGYFYLGATYHRPFGDMAVVEDTWRANAIEHSFREGIVGTYLTFDVRYFFHEDPEKRGRRPRN